MRLIRRDLRLVATVLGAVAALVSAAAETTLGESAARIERWSAAHRRLGLPRGRRVARVVRHEIGGSAPVFHETRFEGGGFAVVDASSSDGELIAFSDSGEVVEDANSPLWALLRRHMMMKAAYGGSSRLLTQTSSGAVDDLRVAPLVQTRWNQETSATLPCYNYYTPKSYPCGCVATAMAQVMRYHEWPTQPSCVETNECWIGSDLNHLSSTNLSMKGGPYDWAGMPYRPGDGGASESNREAIGRITYDCGVAMHMAYAPGGSGAMMTPIHLQLKSVFGYASAYTLNVDYETYPGGSLDETSMRNAILANLDAKSPVILGIYSYDSTVGYDSGHCIVADGYGFIDGKTYVHLNFGWTSGSIAWYKLPDIGTSYGYNVVDSAAYNILPQATGTIVSGRVMADETNVVGVTVRACRADNGQEAGTCQTDTNGVYALVLSESTRYNLVVTGGERVWTNVVTTGHSASYTSYDWDTDTAWYSEEIVCGNRWGNDFDLSGSGVRIVSCEPAESSVYLLVGTTGVFSVAVENPKAQELTYGWTLDDLPVPDATTANCSWTPAFGDRGTHELSCHVSTSETSEDIVQTWTVYVYGDVYVSAATGDDLTGTGETNAPFATIQAAQTNAVDGDIIFVGPGTYAGPVEVGKALVHIVSTDGPEVTTIDANGTGPCYKDIYNDFQSWLVGFTLCRGANPCGGGVFGGAAMRCIIRDCQAYSRGKFSASGYGGGASGAYLNRCTVFGNVAARAGGGVDCESFCKDSIIWGNTNSVGAVDNCEVYEDWLGRIVEGPSLSYCCTEPSLSIGESNIFVNPLFVGAATNDFRLYDISPCIGTGFEGVNRGAYDGPGVTRTIPTLPPDPTGEQVRQAVVETGYADTNVTSYIGSDAVRYAAFSDWATNFPSTAVVICPKSYTSFVLRDLLDTPRLLVNDGETKLAVTEFVPKTSGLEATVRLTDGDVAVALKAAKEAFAGKVRLGSTLLSMGPATAADIMAAEPAADGSVKLTIRPPASSSAFMGLRVE